MGEQLRIAAYGKPGAGKSTFCRIVARTAEGLGLGPTTLSLAAPLYELQAVIYAYAGAPLVESRAQDGKLLNFLGAHLRRINSGALVDNFSARLAKAESNRDCKLVLCDDARAPDVAGLQHLGFQFIEIQAPDALRHARIADRHDLVRGSEDDVTELPFTPGQHLTVDNTTDLDTLERKVQGLLSELLK